MRWICWNLTVTPKSEAYNKITGIPTHRISSQSSHHEISRYKAASHLVIFVSTRATAVGNMRINELTTLQRRGAIEDLLKGSNKRVFVKANLGRVARL